MNPNPELTVLLRAWQAGNQDARNELFAHVNKNMYAIAKNLLRNDRQAKVLQPTDLVNECVIRMFGLNNLSWLDRAHFIGATSSTMRRILVDESRRSSALKRDAIEVTLSTAALGISNQSSAMSDLDSAMSKLSEVSPELLQVVELKFFGGLTNKEVAVVQNVSEATVKRSWRAARAWLFNEILHPQHHE